MFSVYSVFCIFCVLFLLLYIDVSFLFLYKFTDHCHWVETYLQLINIISYIILIGQACWWVGGHLPVLSYKGDNSFEDSLSSLLSNWWRRDQCEHTAYHWTQAAMGKVSGSWWSTPEATALIVRDKPCRKDWTGTLVALGLTFLPALCWLFVGFSWGEGFLKGRNGYFGWPMNLVYMTTFNKVDLA
jgi:hypothetical protein